MHFGSCDVNTKQGEWIMWLEPRGKRGWFVNSQMERQRECFLDDGQSINGETRRVSPDRPAKRRVRSCKEGGGGRGGGRVAFIPQFTLMNDE